MASQGMIHGGLKYALSGALTGASEAIASMPERWRQCLGLSDTKSSYNLLTANVDLIGSRLLSEKYYMFAKSSTLGRLTTFFASKSLRGRIEKLPKNEWPSSFQGFDGVVYSLNDFVVDTTDLLNTLIAPFSEYVFQLELTEHNFAKTPEGYVIELDDIPVRAKQLICCAGNGSQNILDIAGIGDIAMQQRPLKQVIVRPRHNVQMYAHCLTGITSNEPRITITSHPSDAGLVWYLGGRLATTGIDRTDQEQLAFAKQELEFCLPWLDWQAAQFEILSVNRAEAYQSSSIKPDEAFVQRSGDFIQCFPTKLSLAPNLGDKTLQLLGPPTYTTPLRSNHTKAQVGKPQW